MSIDCIHCGEEIEEKTDTTVSNIETSRASIGQHTGDIYFCDKCENYTLDCFLTGKTEYWDYSL